MEQKKPISHFVAALIIAAVLIIYTIVLQFTGNAQNTGLAWISYLFILAGLVIFINMYGKAMNNQVTFGNLFSYGFKTTAFLALIMIAFTVIFFLALPDFKQKMFDTARQKMEEQGKLSDAQIDQAMQTWKNMFWLLMIGVIVLFYAIIGAIGSLIGAAVTKKKPVNPLDQMSL